MDEIEIPEAIREDIELSGRTKLFSLPIIVGAIICLTMVGLLSAFLLLPIIKPARQIADSTEPAQTSKPEIEAKTPESSTDSIATPTEPSTQAGSGLLGHLPYDVALESELEAISADGRLKMQSAAAKKFQQMQAAAKADGVVLTAISAFRDDNTQEQQLINVLIMLHWSHSLESMYHDC